jgi:rfaE bifunctional protein nucleotidyltransferase chain/domain
LELTNRKIIDPGDIESAVARLREEWRHSYIVQCSGCFDLLHVGHIRYLCAAASFGDLIVTINGARRVEQLKGRSIYSLEERLFTLANLECVTFVTWFDEDNPIEVIHRIKPDLYVKGYDYTSGKAIPELEAVFMYGAFRCIPRAMSSSVTTTEIISRITSLSGDSHGS